MSVKILPGRAAPLGATCGPEGTNFAVSSNGDEVRLCLFDRDGTETQFVLPERDGDVWHGFVSGVGPGKHTDSASAGRTIAGAGYGTTTKLLLDPYARAIHGEVRLEPELLDYGRRRRSRAP
jgi:isoamylase